MAIVVNAIVGINWRIQPAFSVHSQGAKLLIHLLLVMYVHAHNAKLDIILMEQSVLPVVPVNVLYVLEIAAQHVRLIFI